MAKRGINVTFKFDVFALAKFIVLPCICTMQKNFISHLPSRKWRMTESQMGIFVLFRCGVMGILGV